MHGRLAWRYVCCAIRFSLKMPRPALLFFKDVWAARNGYPSVNYAKHAGGSQGRIGVTQLGPIMPFVLFVLETEPQISRLLEFNGCVHQQPQPGLGVVGLRCNMACSCNTWNCQPAHACKISNLWHLLRGGKGAAAESFLGGVRKGRMECRKDDFYLLKRIRNRSSIRQHVLQG